METTSETIVKRLKQLNSAIQAAKFDGIALNPGPSLKYLTGLEFSLNERPVIALFTPDRPVTIIVPELEAMKIMGVFFEVNTISYPEDPTLWSKSFAHGADVSGLAGKKVGVEQRSFRMLELNLIKMAMSKSKFVSIEAVISNLRMFKDEQELASMREAVRIAQKALQETLPKIKIGMTEREVASVLTGKLFQFGSGAALPYTPIVSSGPNGANPHAYPSDRKLAVGDMLVIDFGTSVDGYFSDITRTYGVGEVEPEMETIHHIVQEANAAARAVVKPGVTCGRVDGAARQVIEAAGYGEYFIHRTGHGLGLEIHEEPYIRADNAMILKPGMTFTIEPGIYLPDRGGVRIEDDVVVSEDGIESLTDLPRDLSFVG